jgi:hypothetical protein
METDSRVANQDAPTCFSKVVRSTAPESMEKENQPLLSGSGSSSIYICPTSFHFYLPKIINNSQLVQAIIHSPRRQFPRATSTWLYAGRTRTQITCILFAIRTTLRALRRFNRILEFPDYDYENRLDSVGRTVGSGDLGSHAFIFTALCVDD